MFRIVCTLCAHPSALTVKWLTFLLEQVFLHNVQHALQLTEEQDAVFPHHRNVSINGRLHHTAAAAAASSTVCHANATVQQQLPAIQYITTYSPATAVCNTTHSPAAAVCNTAYSPAATVHNIQSNKFCPQYNLQSNNNLETIICAYASSMLVKRTVKKCKKQHYRQEASGSTLPLGNTT